MHCSKHIQAQEMAQKRSNTDEFAAQGELLTNREARSSSADHCQAEVRNMIFINHTITIGLHHALQRQSNCIGHTMPVIDLPSRPAGMIYLIAGLDLSRVRHFRCVKAVKNIEIRRNWHRTKNQGIESRGIIKKRKEESLEERVRRKSFVVSPRLVSRIEAGHKS